MPAFAQDTARSNHSLGEGLDEIIVTAQKRTQNVQDVPIAISAIGGDALQAKGIANVGELGAVVPGLKVTSPFGGTLPNFSLRGISLANEFSAPTASPIGVYVDEVYQSFRAASGQQMFDLDRLEVLRGPQGTLYGRNTTGGAISFFTKGPDLTGNSGYLTLGYGNYDTKRVEGAAEITMIANELGIRIAGTAARGGGWIYDPAQQRHVGTTNSYAGRATLRWKPSAGLDLSLKLYGARDNPLSPAPYSEGQLAGGRDILGYSRLDPSQNGGHALGRDEVSADTSGHYFTASRGAALKIKYDLGRRLSLTSVTGYDWARYRNATADCDGSPNDLCAIRLASTSRSFNQDLRLGYLGGRLHATAGLYFGSDSVLSHNQPDFFGVLRPILLGAGLPGSYGNAPIATGDSIRVLPAFAVDPSLTPANPGFCLPVTVNPAGFLDARSLLALLADVAATNSGGGGFGGAASAACRAAGAPPPGPILGDQVYRIKRPSKAIYGDASYDITDKLTLSIGLRYTADRIDYLDARTTLLDLDGQSIFASTIPYSFPYNRGLPSVSQSRSADRFTGRANLSYHFADGVMGYLNYSRGYRSGSYNGLAYQGLDQIYYIKPETVDAYEAGLKMMLFARRVRLNLAGFYYNYRNQQFTQTIGATSFTRNGNGRLFGGEAEIAVRLLDGVHLDGALSLLNSKYVGNKIDPTDPTSATLSINGNPFPFASRETFNGGFDWDLLHREDGRLTLRGDATYTGKYYFDPFKDYGQKPCDAPAAGFNILQAGPGIACGNPGYWLLGGRLSYGTPRWTASLWVKNLTNKFYYSYGLNIAVFGLDYLNRGPPRTYGMDFKLTL